MDPLPFFVMIDSRLHRDYIFLLLILIPVVSYLFISRLLMKDQSKSSVSRLKRRISLTMQAGSIAYLIGALF